MPQWYASLFSPLELVGQRPPFPCHHTVAVGKRYTGEILIGIEIALETAKCVNDRMRDNKLVGTNWLTLC